MQNCKANDSVMFWVKLPALCVTVLPRVETKTGYLCWRLAAASNDITFGTNCSKYSHYLE